MNFDGHAKQALIVVCLTLLVSGIGFRLAAHSAAAYLKKEPVELRRTLTNIPKRLGPWTASGEDQKLTAETEEQLGTDQYINRFYVRDEGSDDRKRVEVHLPYYTGMIDAVPHVPDRCNVAGGMVAVGLPQNIDLPLDRSGWRPDPEHVNLKSGEPYPLLTFARHVTGEAVTVRMPIGDFKLRTTEFRHLDWPENRIYAGYFFIANAQVTPRPEGVRKFAFDLTTKYAYYLKVQFTMVVPKETTREEFVAEVASLVTELLPEIMLCLPDWSEIESRSSE